VGRESFHGTKELFNLPPLVLKAIGTYVALPLLKLGLPEQAVGWLPLMFEIGNRR
jgi:hypothetical protein